MSRRRYCCRCRGSRRRLRSRERWLRPCRFDEDRSGADCGEAGRVGRDVVETNHPKPRPRGHTRKSLKNDQWTSCDSRRGADLRDHRIRVRYLGFSGCPKFLYARQTYRRGGFGRNHRGSDSSVRFKKFRLTHYPGAHCVVEVAAAAVEVAVVGSHCQVDMMPASHWSSASSVVISNR